MLKAYEHYAKQLKTRYNQEITYTDYVQQLVIKRNKKHKKGSYIKIRDKNIVRVFFIGEEFEYPITIYPIDKYNKNRQYYVATNNKTN